MSLPDLIGFSGDWDSYLDSLYSIYIREIVNAGLCFQDMRVSYRRHPEEKGKGKGFWHCIQEGKNEEGRLPDFRRCERLRWIPWVLQNYNTDTRISWWPEPNKGEEDIVFWIEEESYVVVLTKRNGYFLLLTAYYVDRPHKIDSLRRNRQRYGRDRE